jgi:hypothetical protein
MEQLAHPEALGWVALLLALGLVRGPPMAGPSLEVAFAVQVALAMLYDPPAAAAIACLGAVDLRLLPRRPLASWSRCPLALVTVAAGGALFHRLAGPGEPTARLLAAFAACAALLWLVEVAAMAAAGGPARVTAPRLLLARMDAASPGPSWTASSTASTRSTARTRGRRPASGSASTWSGSWSASSAAPSRSRPGPAPAAASPSCCRLPRTPPARETRPGGP